MIGNDIPEMVLFALNRTAMMGDSKNYHRLLELYKEKNYLEEIQTN